MHQTKIDARLRQLLDAMLQNVVEGNENSLLTINHHEGQLSVEFNCTASLQVSGAIAARADVFGVAMVIQDGGAKWQRIDLDGNPIQQLPAGALEASPIFSQIQPITIDGQHMVRVPRFYYRVSDITLNGEPAVAYHISHAALEGFSIHPAFTSRDQFYVGAYQASVQDDKLSSVPGVMPETSRTLHDFDVLAGRRNVDEQSGWMQWSALQLGAIQMLYLVEHATMDCQAATGRGRVAAQGVAAVDAPDVLEASYRGITGLWGNVWQWLGGLKTVDGEICIQRDDGSWMATGQRAATNESVYPLRFARGVRSDASEILSGVFLSVQSVDSADEAATPQPQYFYDDGEYFPIVGGAWSHAAAAGLWNVACSNAASYSHTNIGARLAKV